MVIFISFLAIFSFSNLSVFKHHDKFPLIEFTTLYGKKINTSFFQNGDKPVLIITWSIKWCLPCSELIDDYSKNIEQLREQYGVRVIAINEDHNVTAEEVKAHMEKRNWDVEVYMDPKGEIMERFEHNAAPLIFFMDGKTNINFHYAKFDYKARNVAGVFENIGKKRQYFDENWNWSYKSDAVYSRNILPKDSTGIASVTDYYADGTIQMTGSYKSIYPRVRQGNMNTFLKMEKSKKENTLKTKKHTV